MQTFLPYPCFVESAKCLDRQRLGKQRVEVLQLLRTLAGETQGWTSHPCTRMWRGHELDLICYGKAVCEEWTGRGYVDNCLDKILAYTGTFATRDAVEDAWLGDKTLHSSHRACLLYKDPAHYGQFDWLESPAVPDERGRLPYVWPVEVQS